jgi:hypothetical protein
MLGRGVLHKDLAIQQFTGKVSYLVPSPGLCIQKHLVEETGLLAFAFLFFFFFLPFFSAFLGD